MYVNVHIHIYFYIYTYLFIYMSLHSCLLSLPSSLFLSFPLFLYAFVRRHINPHVNTHSRANPTHVYICIYTTVRCICYSKIYIFTSNFNINMVCLPPPPFTDAQIVERILRADFKFDPEYWSHVSAEAKDVEFFFHFL